MAATDGFGPDSSSWQNASLTRSSSAPPDANWLMSNPALRAIKKQFKENYGGMQMQSSSAAAGCRAVAVCTTHKLASFTKRLSDNGRHHVAHSSL